MLKKTINGSIDPVDMLVAAWKATYGKDRVLGWIEMFEKRGGISGREFSKEDVIKG